MMRYLIFCLLLLVSFTCNNGCSSQDFAYFKMHASTDAFKSKSMDAKWEKADAFFQSFASKSGFNGAVLIAQHDTVVYKNAFGYANLNEKTPLTVSSPFQLASVSKQFTAAAIMLLKQQGKISYSDYVSKYIKGFPYQVTIRELLNHRGGLSNYIYFTEKYCKDQKKALTNDQVIAFYKTLTPAPYFQPNKKFNYSNTGYMLLASIVEAVSKQAFGDFMKKEFFTPLGMSHSFIYKYGASYDSLTMTLGYSNKQKKSKIDYLDGVVGDKGVYSTVEDLFTWDQALYSGRVLSAETMEEAFEGGSPELKKKNYGFGWRIIYNEAGEKIVYHRGWWHGYKSLFLRNLDKHNTIIMLSNVASNSFLNIQSVDDILQAKGYDHLLSAEEGEGE